MNFALSALILIILLLPGVAVQKAYYSSLVEKKSTIYIPFSELLFKGIVISFVVHCAGVSIVRYFGDTIDFQLLYNLLIAKEINFSNAKFTTGFLQFSMYNIVVIIILFLFTKALKIIIQRSNKDLDWYSLRNTNYWFQIFSARYLDIHDIQGEREKTDIIFLDILSTKDIIYSGFLVDFNYSPSKDLLENIVLRSVRKRCIYKPQNSSIAIEQGAISEIPGDVLLIPANCIENINIYYVNLVDEEDVNVDAPKST
jgi:hypothetical protein